MSGEGNKIMMLFFVVVASALEIAAGALIAIVRC